ncbi:hypothetical protein ABKN59_006214 [Abortiporus biennis]
MKLNLDVMALFMSFLERRPDVLAVIKTCRVLHSMGIRYLLAIPFCFDDTGQFKRALQTQAFLEYIIKYPERRRYIKEIIFHGSYRGFTSHRDIFKIAWQDCDNLEKLEILSIEDLYPNASPSCFPSHSISLLHLRELHIDCHEPHTSTMINNLHAPLQSLILCLDEGENIISGNVPKLLQNFTSTLEDLHISFGQWYSTPRYPPIRFPRVHSLSLQYNDIEDIGSIVLAFPNVTSLRILKDDDDYNDMKIIRTYNLDSMREIEDSGNGWKQLEEVSGEILPLFAVGLSYKVSFMDVRLDNDESEGLCSSGSLRECSTENGKNMFNYSRLTTLTWKFLILDEMRENQAKVREFIDIFTELLGRTQSLKHLTFKLRYWKLTSEAITMLGSILCDDLIDKFRKAAPGLHSIQMEIECNDPSLTHDQKLMQNTQVVWKSHSD